MEKHGFVTRFSIIKKRRPGGRRVDLQSKALLSVFSPRHRREEHDHREQLQSSGQHVERQQHLERGMVEAVIPHRADHAESGADVVETGELRGEVRREIRSGLQA